MLIATVPYVGKRLHLDPDPEPDPDPKLITDPDPDMQIISDPAGSGSTTLRQCNVISIILFWMINIHTSFQRCDVIVWRTYYYHLAHMLFSYLHFHIRLTVI
jgi:hypothetical protein